MRSRSRSSNLTERNVGSGVATAAARRRVGAKASKYRRCMRRLPWQDGAVAELLVTDAPFGGKFILYVNTVSREKDEANQALGW